MSLADGAANENGDFGDIRHGVRRDRGFITRDIASAGAAGATAYSAQRMNTSICPGGASSHEWQPFLRA
jgi:hypothetical protein